jgi:hypothetical protein
MPRQIREEEQRLTEDEIARRILGPRGVPGAQDTAKMTPQQAKNIPKTGEFDGHTAWLIWRNLVPADPGTIATGCSKLNRLQPTRIRKIAASWSGVTPKSRPAPVVREAPQPQATGAFFIHKGSRTWHGRLHWSWWW